MTLQQFVDKWNNQYQERRDSKNYRQCFDLVVGYVIDVLGLPETTFQGLLNAYQIFENPTETTSRNFDFIKNTAFGVPKAGDIIVFSKSYNNTAGHVAVVVEANINSFKAFSQNDPTGAKCIIKTYMYDNILGWLRAVITSGTDLQACLTAHKQAMDAVEERDRIIEVNVAVISGLNTKLKAQQVQIDGFQSAMDSKLAMASLDCLSSKKDLLNKVDFALKRLAKDLEVSNG